MSLAQACMPTYPAGLFFVLPAAELDPAARLHILSFGKNYCRGCLEHVVSPELSRRIESLMCFVRTVFGDVAPQPRLSNTLLKLILVHENKGFIQI
jgi:hypothetical protein